MNVKNFQKIFYKRKRMNPIQTKLFSYSQAKEDHAIIPFSLPLKKFGENLSKSMKNTSNTSKSLPWVCIFTPYRSSFPFIPSSSLLSLLLPPALLYSFPPFNFLSLSYLFRLPNDSLSSPEIRFLSFSLFHFRFVARRQPAIFSFSFAL